MGLPAVPSAMPLVLSTSATPSAPSICIASLRAVVWSFMGGSPSGEMGCWPAPGLRFRGDGGRGGLSPRVSISDVAAAGSSDRRHQAIVADSINVHIVID